MDRAGVQGPAGAFTTRLILPSVPNWDSSVARIARPVCSAAAKPCSTVMSAPTRPAMLEPEREDFHPEPN